MAVAIDDVHERIYVVHRALYSDVGVQYELLPTDLVSVVDGRTGAVTATVKIGDAVNNGVDEGIAVDSTHNRVYVTNPGENSVSIIDTTTNTVVATTSVDGSPVGVAADPSAGLAYVADGDLVTILGPKGTVTGTVPLKGTAVAVAVDPASGVAYVAEAGPNALAVVNGKKAALQAQVEMQRPLVSVGGIAVDPGGKVYLYNSNGGIVVFDTSSRVPREVTGFQSGGFLSGLAVDPKTHLVYAADPGSNEVHVFKSDGTKVGSIKVLRYPTGIAIQGATRRAYVTDALSDSLTVVNLDQRQATEQVPLGTSIWGVTYDPSAKRIYAANAPADAVSVLDAVTGKVVGTWAGGPRPVGLAIDSQLKRLYVTDADDGALRVLSTSDGSIQATIDLGKTGANLVAVDPRTHRAYATGSNGLTVLDGATDQIVATVPVGNRPVGIAVDEVGNRVYVASQQSGAITVIDATTNKVAATWHPKLGNVWGLAVDPTLNRLYVTVVPNTIGAFTGLEILDASSGAFMAQLATGREAVFVTVDNKTHQVFVSDTDGKVSVVDGQTSRLVTRVNLGGSLNGVAVDSGSGTAFVGNAANGTVDCVKSERPTVTTSAPVTPEPATDKLPTASAAASPSPTHSAPSGTLAGTPEHVTSTLTPTAGATASCAGTLVRRGVYDMTGDCLTVADDSGQAVLGIGVVEKDDTIPILHVAVLVPTDVTSVAVQQSGVQGGNPWTHYLDQVGQGGKDWQFSLQQSSYSQTYQVMISSRALAADGIADPSSGIVEVDWHMPQPR